MKLLKYLHKRDIIVKCRDKGEVSFLLVQNPFITCYRIFWFQTLVLFPPYLFRGYDFWCLNKTHVLVHKIIHKIFSLYLRFLIKYFDFCFIFLTILCVYLIIFVIFSSLYLIPLYFLMRRVPLVTMDTFWSCKAYFVCILMFFLVIFVFCFICWSYTLLLL